MSARPPILAANELAFLVILPEFRGDPERDPWRATRQARPLHATGDEQIGRRASHREAYWERDRRR